MDALLSGMTPFDWLALVSATLFALAFGMRDIRLLRWLTVLACVIDLVVYYFIRPGQPLWVQFGESLVFIAINVYHLVVLWQEQRARTFHGREGLLFSQNFTLLSPGEFRRLLKLGEWQDQPPGTLLIGQGEPVSNVLFFVAGSGDVRLDGQQWVATIEPGQVAGEVSYFTDGIATADVLSRTACTLFALPHDVLRSLKQTHPDLYIKLTYVLGSHVADKLSASNERQSTWGPSAFSDEQTTDVNTLLATVKG